MRGTVVEVGPGRLERVLELVALLGGRLALEAALFVDRVVAAAVPRPDPRDGGSRIDANGSRGEREGVAVAPGADVDGDAVAAGPVLYRPVVVAGLAKVLVDGALRAPGRGWDAVRAVTPSYSNN